MHNALSWQRVHQPKGHTIATYHPESNMAYAYNPKGPLFAKMGQVLSPGQDPLGSDKLRGQRLWLLPEEALYLIERGTIDVRWPASEEEAAAGQPGLPMSLQGAYAMFIGGEDPSDGALTFERYSVYSALKRGGYTVLRAPSWNGPGPPLGPEHFPPVERQTWRIGLSSLASWPRRLLSANLGNYTTKQEGGPLTEPGLYRSYVDVYRRLALIDSFDPTVQRCPNDAHTAPTDPGFRVTYHVFKPGSNTFKKTAPGPPDFRIAVVDARKTSMPDLQQLGALMETVPFQPPVETAQMYAKLRHGYKNVILALVDQGITSYLRIADSAFGNLKLYERVPNNQRGKQGGGKGGRGRGKR